MSWFNYLLWFISNASDGLLNFWSLRSRLDKLLGDGKRSWSGLRLKLRLRFWLRLNLGSHKPSWLGNFIVSDFIVLTSQFVVIGIFVSLKSWSRFVLRNIYWSWHLLFSSLSWVTIWSLTVIGATVSADLDLKKYWLHFIEEEWIWSSIKAPTELRTGSVSIEFQHAS